MGASPEALITVVTDVETLGSLELTERLQPGLLSTAHTAFGVQHGLQGTSSVPFQLTGVAQNHRLQKGPGLG